jgi:hypothetical protein
MRRPPRTGVAISGYLALLAIGVLLCAAVAHDYIAELFRHGDTIEIAAPSKASRTHHYAPTINWGGARE